MKCVICGEQIITGMPCEILEDGLYCGDCAFLRNIITSDKYIKKYLFWIDLDGVRAIVHDGKIYVSAYNEKFPFERTSQSERKSKQYKEWRTAVFARDGFKCQICGSVGGVLNAHHIKEFSKYPKLRYVIDNGITLCEQCHRNVHREKVKISIGRQTKQSRS